MAVCSIWILGGGGAGAAPRGAPALIGGSQKFMPLKPPPQLEETLSPCIPKISGKVCIW